MKKMKKCALMAMVACCSLALTTTAFAQGVTTVKSQVISMKAKDRTLTLRGAKAGERVQYYVSPGAKISRKGQPADLRMLRPGDIVTITVNAELRDNPFSLGTVVAVKAPVPQQSAPAETPKAVTSTPPRPSSPGTPAVVAQAARTELPKTAGWLPLSGLIGAVLLGASGALSLRRRRS